MKRLKYTGAYTYLCSIIVIMILIVGCQSVTNQAFEEDPELNFTSTEIIPSYDQHSMSLLSGVFTRGKIVEQGGYFASDAGNIDLSKALKVQELKDGTVRYTFRVETNDPLVFENLIIRETQEGRVTSYIMRYQPDHAWLAENGGSFNFESFTGTLIARTTEGKNLMEVTFVNGESTSFDAPKNKGKSMTENCEDGGDGSGSTGGGGSTDGGGDTGDGYDGGDGGYNGGDGSSGGGSTGGDDGGGGSNSGYDYDSGCYWYILEGGTLFIDCPVVEIGEDPDIMTKTNTVCDPIDEVYDGECMDEHCDPDPVGVLEPENLMEIIIADLAQHPCTEEIFEQIQELESKGIRDIINRFAGEETEFLYKIELKDSGTFQNPANAAESYWIDGLPTQYYTHVSIDFVNTATTIAIARVLMHEAIHVYLLSWVDEYSVSPDLMEEFRSNFPALWEYYINSVGGEEGAHHETIAQKFIDTISDGLQGLFGGQYPNQFYKDLAWGGLYDTEVFNSIFDEEEKERIKNINDTEDHNLSNANGEPCEN